MDTRYRLGEVVIGREEIAAKVRELAARINKDYAGREIFVVGVLNGAMVFLADLIRELDVPITMDFIVVSSYGVQTKSSGVVLLVKDVEQPLDGKHVLIVEDLIDSGLTLSYIKDLFESRNPASLSICTIFDKPQGRKADLTVDYSGIVLEDRFVVGYGLDYANQYRNLPDLRVLEEW